MVRHKLMFLFCFSLFHLTPQLISLETYFWGNLCLILKLPNICVRSVSHGSDYEAHCLLGCDAVQSDRPLQVLPFPYSVSLDMLLPYSSALRAITSPYLSTPEKMLLRAANSSSILLALIASGFSLCPYHFFNSRLTLQPWRWEQHIPRNTCQITPPYILADSNLPSFPLSPFTSLSNLRFRIQNCLTHTERPKSKGAAL
jgi:hypothetical protein